MPTWAWVLLSVLTALLGLIALGLLLLRIRYLIEWRGELSGTLSGASAGTARIETRFLWINHVWEPLKDSSWSIADLFGDDDLSDAEEALKAQRQKEDAEARKSGVDPEPETGFSESARPARGAEEPAFLNPASASTRPEPTPSETSGPQKKSASSSDPNRKRRALFRLVTDRDAWRLLARYGLKVLRLVLKLLRPRVEAAVGHPDPAFLGRLSGKWYAIRPLLNASPLLQPQVYFRFQDRHPSLWVRVQGSISALSLLAFGVRLIVAFPFILLARRAVHGWRRHRLVGWRAWVYRKLQTAQ